MAVVRVIAVALALASATASSSHPSESARNQYEAREDRLQPLQLLNEATDHRPKVIEESTLHPALQIELNRKRLKSRRKRSYTPWSRQMSYSVPYQSITVWKPPFYQLSRPYYIPIFGVAGRPPIYFPPQPLFVNPGSPLDNPPNPPYQGPTYLPPSKETTMTVEDRFNGGDKGGNTFNGGDNKDDRPVWNLGENEVTQRPTTAMVPTRRTRPPGAPKTHPPLIHNPINGGERPAADASNVVTVPPPPSVQTRPPQSLPAAPNQPSRCVWAIISCCSATGDISYDCFEQRGCPGAFWDNSPCESEFAKAAISAALNYYESK